jgi:hypothetical protein
MKEILLEYAILFFLIKDICYYVSNLGKGLSDKIIATLYTGILIEEKQDLYQ